MIEKLTFEFPAGVEHPSGRGRVGVVASGDLEVLLEPALDNQSTVKIRTSVGGFREQWLAVLQRFFLRHNVAVQIEINDSGASPPVVSLRLEQALEVARNHAR
jgi:malonate decarboxylase delta subunit